MFAAAIRAFSEILSPPYRRVLLRSLGITAAMLAAVWAAVYATFEHYVQLPWPGVDLLVDIITGIGIVVGLGFLVAPVTSLFAGLFLDEIAEEVERRHYPLDPPGRAMPLGESILSALRFTALVILVNAVVLLLLLLPGINVLAFFVANAYLLGREYFEMVASRFLPREEVAALRNAEAGRLFFGGLMIALVLAVPFVNLLTPLFATAFMVHLYKDVARRAGLDRKFHGGPLPAARQSDEGSLP